MGLIFSSEVVSRPNGHFGLRVEVRAAVHRWIAHELKRLIAHAAEQRVAALDFPRIGGLDNNGSDK